MPSKTRGGKRGSIFLLALTCLTVLFILAFSITFFTGSEDWSAAITYESEVAFNLAESAIEEFVARLKNSLNNDDADNQLYKVLRSPTAPVDRDIPLDAAQVARLTTYTRETARQIYGIQFGQDLVTSQDFQVEAVLRLSHLNPVEARSGEKHLYTHRRDYKEKQAELTVTARVSYRGQLGKVTLSFLIRVVKAFVPPFNYFTLFVKDGTVFGGSHFNTWPSLGGEQQKSLTLDNGWRFISGMENFNAVNDHARWEAALAKLGRESFVPPGRVYLGQDPDANLPPSIILQATNACKLMIDDPALMARLDAQVNSQEGFFQRFDVPFMGLRDFVKKYMEMQGKDKVKAGWLLTGWDNKTKIDILNVGGGEEVGDTEFGGAPAFGNALRSFINFRGARLNLAATPDERLMFERLYPPVENSGLKLFGYARSVPPIGPRGQIQSDFISPTLVYGPVWRMYYRIVRIMVEDGFDKEGARASNVKIELPFLATEPPIDGSAPMLPLPMGIERGKVLSASEAMMLFEWAGVPEDHRNLIANNWEKLPDGMRKLNRYEKFMSNAGVEPYNMGLGNFLTRMKPDAAGRSSLYEGPLEDFLVPFLANEEYANMPGRLINPVRNSPIREFFLGDLWHALPDHMNAYLLDFYFIPRATEDFFRGRTTVSMGGISYDRFYFKYIDDAAAYMSGANNQTLELNGIIALNDQEPLMLRNLNFRGRGIIYSSPMMGGGKVLIAGDFFPAGAMSGNTSAFGSNPDNDMMTIVAPQIIIDTSFAQGDYCYVEANLISVNEPLIVLGPKRVIIKGTVVSPRLNLEETFRDSPGGTIIYNPLNSTWRNDAPQLMDHMYVAKIVTGGVGRFDWKYERTEN